MSMKRSRSTKLGPQALFFQRGESPIKFAAITSALAWPACSRLRPEHKHLHRMPTSTPGTHRPLRRHRERFPR